MQKTHQLHPSRMPKPPHRRQGDSDELDVFGATRYFSGGVDGEVRRAMREREERTSWSAGRRSLDTLKAKLPYQSKKVEQNNVKDKNSKQPNSPGGKLASFLNSLFKQTIYRKRSITEKDGYIEEAPHAGRRRSSISYFQTTGGSSESGRPDVTPGGHRKPVHFCSRREACYDQREEDWPTERAKSIDQGCREDRFVFDGNGSHGQETEVLWSSKDLAEKEERDELWLRKDEEDEGDESDSSSDLFELKSFDLAGELQSFDLPVYGSPILQL